MHDALFNLDDFEPLRVLVMSCAACIGVGRTLMGKPCTSCDGVGRRGSSIWRGSECLARIGTAGAL